MIPGANPIANSINPAAPINGTAQGMPAPKAFGAYTNSPTSNVMGTWGAAQSSGIPGDGANSPQGAPSGGGNYGGGSGGGSSSGSGYGRGRRPIHSGLVSNGYGGYGRGRYTQAGANKELAAMSAGNPLLEQNYQSQLQQEGKPSTVSGGYGGGNTWSSTIGSPTSTAPGGGAGAAGVFGGSGGGVTGVPAAGSGGGYTPSGGWSGSGSGTYHVGSYAGGSEAFSMKDGGPVPGVKHTSKKVKGYDDGGSVSDGPDNENNETSAQGNSSDAGSAIPPDNSTASSVSDSSQGSGNTPSDSQALLQNVHDILTYGRQKNGLTNEVVHQAFNTDSMRASSNVEDNRQGAGSIDTGQPVTKAAANQALPNINGSSSGPAAPWPYNGSGTVLTAIPADNSQAPAMAAGGALPGTLGGGAPQGGRGGMGGGFGGVGGGMRRGGGGDITGARGMGGGMGSIRPDLSPRGSGGFLAMKKGGAIPEEGEDNE